MTSEDRLEFPLAQGWTKGLVIGFEDKISSLKFDLSDCFHVNQVHGKDFIEVSPASKSGSETLGTADALVARGAFFKDSKKKLLIKTADCQPLVMVDRQNEVVCALHAGWRGLAQGIHRVPFEKKWMDPKFTWVWCGPSLNGEHFEVGADMWSQFSAQRVADERIFSRHQDPTKKYFEAWKFLELEMQDLGIDLLYNVEVDTFENRNYASHRRSVKTGEKRLNNFSWVGFV